MTMSSTQPLPPPAGSVATAAPSTGGCGNPSLVGFSPDMILAYCTTQMGNLNSQIDDLVNQQTGQIADQKVVQDLEGKLGQLGSPPTPDQYKQAVQDYEDAIGKLSPESATCVDLQKQLGSFVDMTSGSPAARAIAQMDASLGIATATPPPPQNAQPGSTQITQEQWSQTLDSVKSTASSIGSSAQLQFLQLQQLCSQQQDVVEQATNMMSKLDSTLLDQAKAG